MGVKTLVSSLLRCATTYLIFLHLTCPVCQKTFLVFRLAIRITSESLTLIVIFSHFNFEVQNFTLTLPNKITHIQILKNFR